MWSPPFVSDREQAANLRRLADACHTDCWTVLHWPPERIQLEWTCLLAKQERRRKLLGMTDPEGNKASVMVTMDVHDL